MFWWTRELRLLSREADDYEQELVRLLRGDCAAFWLPCGTNPSVTAGVRVYEWQDMKVKQSSTLGKYEDY